MLASFIRYLRVALPHLRAAEVPLALELDLVTAYLDVVKARMNERLAFTIEAPAVLRSLAVPPLAVATLVENSVKHGIGVVADGGRIDIRASRDGDALIVAVCDTGAGLSGTGGSGSGLANLRARLNGLYGPAASIVLTLQRPKGARAELRVPARTLVPASTPATEA
jgi:LytS/YehU family sensor histidine kinase